MAERTQGEHWSIDQDRMAAILEYTGEGLTESEFIELALDGDFESDEHQPWLDTAAIEEIAEWAIVVVDGVRLERAERAERAAEQRRLELEQDADAEELRRSLS